MRYIAFEAGATHTLAAVFADDGALLGESRGGPCNPTAYGWDASIRVLAGLADSLLGRDRDDVVALVGMAGACNHKARVEAAHRICAMLGVRRARVAEDLCPILHANAQGQPALLAIAGTGSNVVGQGPDGRWVQVGGRGHVFGDEGSAYAIGVSALRAVADAEDGLGNSTSLARGLVTATGGEQTSDLIAWAGAASKRDIAQLALTVVHEAERGDAVAHRCIERQAQAMARQVLAAADKLGLNADTPVYGHGGLFEGCALYTRAFEDALAAEPILRLAPPQWRGPRAVLSLGAIETLPDWLAEQEAAGVSPQPVETQPPTEAPPAMERMLDAMNAGEIVRAMAEAGVEAARAVGEAGPALAALVQAAGECLRAGGRIIHVGAGTSGRLGVLDASECPPTFGVSPERVQGVIAGGAAALVSSVEGAEDDVEAGRAAMREREVGPLDLVVGVAASGNTPYVAGAIEQATASGARTAILTSNPASTVMAHHRVILDTGAEQVAGSTRMKAGTAAKIALNIISTGAMALAGFVYQGKMIGMRPVNAKLRERAVRIVAEIAAAEPDIARAALEASDWNIAAAILIAREGLESAEAKAIAANAPSPRDAVTG